MTQDNKRGMQLEDGPAATLIPSDGERMLLSPTFVQIRRLDPVSMNEDASAISEPSASPTAARMMCPRRGGYW